MPHPHRDLFRSGPIVPLDISRWGVSSALVPVLTGAEPLLQHGGVHHAWEPT
jgi:hypothetical protein